MNSWVLSQTPTATPLKVLFLKSYYPWQVVVCQEWNVNLFDWIGVVGTIKVFFGIVSVKKLISKIKNFDRLWRNKTQTLMDLNGNQPIRSKINQKTSLRYHTAYIDLIYILICTGHYQSLTYHLYCPVINKRSTQLWIFKYLVLLIRIEPLMSQTKLRCSVICKW